jgi:PKD repeat protein
MKNYLRLAILFSFILNCVTARAGLSGTYTIDPSKAASSTNYTSITGATNALSSSGASGPVIFNIADGIYNEGINLSSPSISGSVTFQSASGDSTKVIIQYLNFYNVNNITVKKITVKSSSNSTVVLNGGNIVLMDNLFFNNFIWPGNNYSYPGCIVLSFNTQVALLNNNITCSGWAGIPGISVNNNTSACDFESNKLFLNNGGNGILVSNSSPTTHSKVINNVISVKCDSSYSANGVLIKYSGNWDFYFNNVLMYGASSQFPTAFGVLPSTLANKVTVYNNNFENKAGGLAMSIQSNGNIVDADYNNYYTTSGALAAWNNSQYSKMLYWSIDNEIDNHSISVSPGYVSATDLHAKNYAFYRKGTPITGITRDMDGDNRNAQAPCIGADEFNPIPHDLEMITVQNFSSGYNCGDSAGPIIVVSNLGYQNEYKVPVIISINGSQKMQDTIPVIFAGSTLNFTFKKSLNTLQGGHFDFKVYTMLSTDADHRNDTVLLSAYFYPNASQPLAHNIVLCHSASANNVRSQYFTLKALKRNSADILYWYGSDGTFFFKGDSIPNRQVTTSTTYYVAAQSTFKSTGGRADTVGVKGRFSTKPLGFQVVVHTDMRLDTLTVYPKYSGSFYMGINGSPVKKYNVTVTKPGQPVKIPVSWDLYQYYYNTIYIDTILTGGLYCNIVGVNAPPVKNDLVSVSELQGDSLYRYFYNLKFSATSPCFSKKVPVNITYIPISGILSNTDSTAKTNGSYNTPDLFCGNKISYFLSASFPDSTFGSAWSASVNAVSYYTNKAYQGIVSKDSKTGKIKISFPVIMEPGNTMFYINTRIKNVVTGCDSGIQIRYFRLNNPQVSINSSYIKCPSDSNFYSNQQYSTYFWQFGDGATSTDQNPYHKYNVPPGAVKHYKIKLSVTNSGGCAAMDSFNVTADGGPESNFNFIKDSILWIVSFSPVNDSLSTVYHWLFGDGTEAFTVKPIHKYIAPGSYTVTLIVKSDLGCSAQTSKTINISHNSGIGGIETDPFKLNIYPNPSQKDFKISYSLSSRSTINIRLLDMLGKEVYSSLSDFVQVEGTHEALIQLPATIANGVYLLKFSAGSQEFTRKVIISKP